MAHVQGRIEWDQVRFHHATQNGAKVKIYEISVSRIFHLTFLGKGCPYVTSIAQV
jgi:hypothetical protein